MSVNESAGFFAPLVIPPTALDVTSTLVNSTAVDLATSISVQSYQEVNGTAYDITFVYTGDGTDSATDVFQEFASALEGLITNWNYLGTSNGAAGVAKCQSVTNQVKCTVASVTPSSTSLVAIAVIALAVIFVASGGIGVARSVASS